MLGMTHTPRNSRTMISTRRCQLTPRLTQEHHEDQQYQETSCEALDQQPDIGSILRGCPLRTAGDAFTPPRLHRRRLPGLPGGFGSLRDLPVRRRFDTWLLNAKTAETIEQCHNDPEYLRTGYLSDLLALPLRDLAGDGAGIWTDVQRLLSQHPDPQHHLRGATGFRSPDAPENQHGEHCEDEPYVPFQPEFPIRGWFPL